MTAKTDSETNEINAVIKGIKDKFQLMLKSTEGLIKEEGPTITLEYGLAALRQVRVTNHAEKIIYVATMMGLHLENINGE